MDNVKTYIKVARETPVNLSSPDELGDVSNILDTGGRLTIEYPYPHLTVDDELFIDELNRMIAQFNKRHKEE